MVLLASTTIWRRGCEKLISTAPMNKRGSRMRAVYCERSPWPHMIRKEPHIAINTRAESHRNWTEGSYRRIVEFEMNSLPVSKLVVLRMKRNHTLSKIGRA